MLFCIISFFLFAMFFTAEIVFSNRKTQEGPAPEGTSAPSKYILLVFVCCCLFFASFFLQCFLQQKEYSHTERHKKPLPQREQVFLLSLFYWFLFVLFSLLLSFCNAFYGKTSYSQTERRKKALPQREQVFLLSLFY